MRCRQARAALLEKEFGSLPGDLEAGLDQHLASCAECAGEAAFERRMVADLALLRGQIPYEIDVRPRVMVEIAERLRPVVPAFTSRELGWATFAAVAAGLTLVAVAIGGLPEWTPALRDIFTVVAGLKAPLQQFASVGFGLLLIPLKLLGPAIASLAEWEPVLRKVQPVAAAGALLATVGMLATIAFFVGRDLLRDPVATSEGSAR